MPWVRIVFIFVVVAGFALWSGRRTRRDPAGSRESEGAGAASGDLPEGLEYEMEARFYREAARGKKVLRFLHIYSQFDVMLIKSLLQSEGIPFHTEFEHMNKVRPGLAIRNYNQITVTILDEDYRDALELIRTYRKSGHEEGRASAFRYMAELLVGNWCVPAAGNPLGMEVLLKDEDD